jgi:hypothetical protein
MSRISPCALRNLALAVLIALAGCATAPSAPAGPSNESLLASAGFKTVAATSIPLLQRLPTLPQGQVTAITQTGRTWFVYPDPVNRRIFVGTRAEYDAYLRLRAQSGLPAQDPYASSIRQDEAMTAKSKRYASVPEWELEEWPEFGNLGW